MRVTSSSFPNVLRSQLERLSTQQARLQTQAGTGQRFSVASEDPRAMRKVLDFQSEIKNLGQFEKNSAALKDTLDSSYAVMTGVKKVSDRATEIGTRADGLRTPEELKSSGTEVDQLIEQALQLANTRHQSSYLFGGTKNTVAPFKAERDTDGHITKVEYVGTADVPEIEIAEGMTISVAVPGANDRGTGARGMFTDTRSGADFFQHLIDLRNQLNQGDQSATTTIRTNTLPNLLKDEENILFHYGSVGAIQTRLETASAIADRRAASLEGLVSKEADADLAETLVSLSEIQNAYTAALKTGGTILGQSLLDYIR